MKITEILKLATTFNLIVFASGDPTDKIRANDGLRTSLNNWAADGTSIDLNLENGKLLEVKINDNSSDKKIPEFRSKFENSIIQTVGPASGWISLQFKLSAIEKE